MGRKAKLTKEQVWVVSQNAKKQTLKAYAHEFGVTIPTLCKAKAAKGPYAYDFGKEFEDEMAQKYFNG